MELVADAVLATMPKDRKKGEARGADGPRHPPPPATSTTPACSGISPQRDQAIFVGTVEGTPSLDYVLARLKAAKAKTVWLRPLMSVAGDHAQNDMAGPEEDSWKSMLEGKGYKVKNRAQGHGPVPRVRRYLGQPHCGPHGGPEVVAVSTAGPRRPA